MARSSWVQDYKSSKQNPVVFFEHNCVALTKELTDALYRPGEIPEKLIQRGLIDSDDFQQIQQENPSSREQAREILSITIKKPDYVFVKLLEILDQEYSDVSSPAKRIRLDPGPSTTASTDKVGDLQKALAEYYQNSYNDDMFCWHDEVHRVNLADIYVPIQWVQLEKTVLHVTEQKLEDYQDILKKASVNGPVKALVRGTPASGKTTFLKKISYDWSTLHLHHDDARPPEELQPLKEYTVIIPVILRLVKGGATLQDTIKHQMDLSNKNLKTLNYLLEEQTEKILLILDGLDEYNVATSEDITNIMKGNLLKRVCCVITSRPEAVSKVKVWERMKYKEAELKGFTDELIQLYVEKIFTRDKDTGDELLKVIFESDHLLELARNPGTLSLICILHDQGRPIGASKEELYEEFVMYILSRWEEKQSSITSKTNRKGIIQKYKSLLLKFGQLASIYDDEDTMTLSFTMEQIDSIVGPNAMQYGILYKSHPVSRYSDCELAFIHKTLQEYLAAMYIKEHEMDEFKKKCQKLEFMEREVSLMRFLVRKVMTPDEAYQFVLYLVQSCDHTYDMEKLLSYIHGRLFTKYKHDAEFQPIIKKNEEVDNEAFYTYNFPYYILYESNKKYQEERVKIIRDKEPFTINILRMKHIHEQWVGGQGNYLQNRLATHVSNLYFSDNCGDPSLELDCLYLDSLLLTKIKKLQDLILHNIHQKLVVEMYSVNLRGKIVQVTYLWLKGIKSLLLNNCKLNKDDVVDLMNGFKSGPCSLQCLKIMDDNLSGAGADIAGLMRLISPPWENLYLVNCKLNNSDLFKQH